MDSDFRARLGGFGRTRIVDNDVLEDQTKPSIRVERDSKIGDAEDSIRWNAPEMMDPDRFGFTKNLVEKLPSKSTDIYALGMTIFEVSFLSSEGGTHCLIPLPFLQILTGRPPFARASDASVVKKVIDGARPERPSTGFNDRLWNLLQLSWSEEYENRGSKRPSIGLILKQLQKDSSDWFRTARFPFPTAGSDRSSSKCILFCPPIRERVLTHSLRREHNSNQGYCRGL